MRAITTWLNSAKSSGRRHSWMLGHSADAIEQMKASWHGSAVSLSATCPRQMHLVDLVSVWLLTAVACLCQQGTSTPAASTQSVPSCTPGYIRPRRTPACGSAAKMAKCDAGCRKCGTLIYNTIFCHFVLPLLPQLPVLKCVRLHLVASILHASPPFSEVIWYV